MLKLHPPEVVRRMTLPQARAVLRAVDAERATQAELLVALFGARL